MELTARRFRQSARRAMGDPRVQGSLAALYTTFHRARIDAAQETPSWEDLRRRGRQVKAHVIENLDYYLEKAAEGVVKAGGHVFFAQDAEEAAHYILDLARRKGVKSVIKTKSMVSEELDLAHRFQEAGIEAVETDLGEYIIQLAQERPYHIIAPAIHKTKEDVVELFHRLLGAPRYERPEELTGEARRQLRRHFLRADMAVTGANFVVAESGTVVLVTNEGNGRMCTSLPRLHVAVTGIEKVVPSLEDLGLFLKLLVRSATGQRLSVYVTAVTGPRGPEEEDGPEEFHLVFLDNGRSRLLADPHLREALYCLRCGACLNACPVYRKVGGHAYGYVYSGPIGAVISPVLTDMKEARDLPYASSLCGACREACPVLINIPRMLLYLRSQLAEGAQYPEARSAPLVERLAMRAWRLTVASPRALGMANRIGRLALLPFRRGRWARRLPPPLSAWTRARDFPVPSAEPFRRRWRRLASGDAAKEGRRGGD